MRIYFLRDRLDRIMSHRRDGKRLCILLGLIDLAKCDVFLRKIC